MVTQIGLKVTLSHLHLSGEACLPLLLSCRGCGLSAQAWHYHYQRGH